MPMNTAQIEWRTIKEFPDFEVSNTGQIRRVVASRGGHKFLPLPYLLSPSKMKNGYLMVSFWKDGKRYGRTVHRLVAAAFLPEPKPGQVVAHWDGTRDNNSATNLRWASCSENALDRHRHGTMLRNGAVIDPQMVPEIKELRAQGLTYAEISQKYGVHRTTIMRAISGHHWPQEVNRGHSPDHLPKVVPRPHNVKGEIHGRAKLTDDKVRQILSSDEPVKALAKKYGVCSRVVYSILSGKIWKHVARPSHASISP